MIHILAKENCTEITKALLISTKIVIGFLILIYFGGTQITCNKDIPYCHHSLNELKKDVEDWEERCLNETRHQINSSCCNSERDFFQEKMRMHTEMCFYSGNY